MNTTLNELRKHHPCSYGWGKLLAYLGKTEADDEPLPLMTILESSGLEDALWALRAVNGCESGIRRYAIWCARQVQDLMEDPRSVEAVGVVEKFVDGLASEDELAYARTAALKAWKDAWGRTRTGNSEQRVALSAARTAYYATEYSNSLEKSAARAAWYASMESARTIQIKAQIKESGFLYEAHVKAQKAKLVELIIHGQRDKP